MQKFKTLDDAIELARYAHRNQQDRAGMPYIDHPLRVLATVQARGAMPYVQMAAVMHDVTEDTAFSLDILAELGFSPAVTRLIALVDRNYSKHEFERMVKRASVDGPFDPRMDASDFYYNNIARNPDARLLKEADIADNLQPWRLLYLPESDQTRLKAKYAHALESMAAAA